MKTKNNFKTILRIVGIIFVAVIGFSMVACNLDDDGGGGGGSGGGSNPTTTTDNSSGGGSNPTTTTDNSSRRYKVEVYYTNSTTNTYLTSTYGEKNYEDVVRADVISKGHTVANTYTNQTFEQVIEKGVSEVNAINMASSYVTQITDVLTRALKTNNQSGCTVWFNHGSVYRFFYVNRTSDGIYKVEVYNTNSTTNTYLTSTYGEKNYEDVVRADVISKGHTVASTYTNQTFEQVIEKGVSEVNAINMASSYVTQITDVLTRALKTNNQSGCTVWFNHGSDYRFFYVSQE